MSEEKRCTFARPCEPNEETLNQSEAAIGLRKVLADPIYNRILRKDVGSGVLDYEVYLRTRELLALQTPFEELVVPDELLFQIQHQTQELWLKCVAFEITNLIAKLDADVISGALSVLDRIVMITRSLAEQIRLMFTLSPSSFHVIRRSLGEGSGLQSPGYNQMLTAAEAALGALQRLLTRREATLLSIYGSPNEHPTCIKLSNVLSIGTPPRNPGCPALHARPSNTRDRQNRSRSRRVSDRCPQRSHDAPVVPGSVERACRYEP